MNVAQTSWRDETFIGRILGHYVSAEMLMLWLLEFFLSFMIIYALFCTPTASPAFWGAFDVRAADRAAALALTIGFTAVALGLYRPEICLESRRLLISSIVAGIIAFPAILVVGHLLSINLDGIVGPDRFWPLKTMSAWIMMLFASRLCFTLAVRAGALRKRLVVIGAPQPAKRVGEAIGSRRTSFYDVAMSVPVAAAGAVTPTDLARERVWGVVVTAEARGVLPSATFLGFRRAGIQVFDEGEFCERQLRRVDLEAIQPDWLVFANGVLSSPVEAALRRCADVLLGLILLLVTLPVIGLAAILVKLDSHGPILYRQERVGLHGRRFTLFKFRSMSVDAEVGRGPSWAEKHDPRVTRVGTIIRRTRIDELPQLINVLRGEMSFIGPRPERPHFVDTLSQLIPNYGDRAFVKPGLTGWAQVNFPYGASVEDARMKLSYDLYYVRHRSLVLDLLILFATVRVILFQEGSR